MNDYQCFGCNTNIIDGQPVVLTTTVVSVKYRQLGESKIYHERCYPSIVSAELEKDLQYAVYEFGHEHWQNCDNDAADCYMCAAYEDMRDRYPNKG